jgi:phosphatidylinositol glycan class B
LQHLKQNLILKEINLFEKRVLIISLIAHLICVWFSIGFHHPDEHFQLIEFANFKCGYTPLEKLPWEYTEQMRPGLQPLMVYLLLKPYYAIGLSNPYHFTTLLRFLSALMALITAWHFHKAIVGQIKSLFLQKVHLILSVLGWGLVYLHVRFSSENWSAIAMAWAIIMLWKQDKKSFWLLGLFAGLSFVFRFQSIFMIGGIGLWMLIIDKTKWINILKVAAGFMLAFAIGTICEYWLYGEWTISGWNYVYQNVIENKAAKYGLEPWYWYFIQIVQQGLSPFSIIMLLSIPAMILYQPKHILTWMMVLFLLGHVVVGHKEFRFLFPLSFFYPFWAIMTIEYLGQKLNRFQNQKWYPIGKNIAWKSFWLANTIALIVMITKPADSTIALNEVFYKIIKKPTILIYSSEFSPNANDGILGATFYTNPLIKSYCIDSFLKDTSGLVNKNVWIFSIHPFAKDEFIFQYGGPFFDSSRTKIVWTKFPKWIYAYNFNGWLERSNAYTVYKLKGNYQP